jgi:hypothetical protein
MTKNIKIRQEIGLYQASIRAAEKTRTKLTDALAAIERADHTSSRVRWQASEDLLRAVAELSRGIRNLEYRIKQAEDLDEQIERNPYATLGTATAAA